MGWKSKFFSFNTVMERLTIFDGFPIVSTVTSHEGTIFFFGCCVSKISMGPVCGIFGLIAELSIWSVLQLTNQNVRGTGLLSFQSDVWSMWTVTHQNIHASQVIFTTSGSYGRSSSAVLTRSAISLKVSVFDQWDQSLFTSTQQSLSTIDPQRS